MSKLLSATIGLIAFAIAMPSFAHDQAEADKAVAAIVATYTEKYNSRDATGVAALYAEDGILVPPGPMVAGRANIEKAWQASFDAGRTGIRYDIKQIKPEGNIVLVVGQFTVKVPEGGSLQDRPGNFVNVYQRAVGSAATAPTFFGMHITNFLVSQSDAAADKAGLLLTARSVGPFGHFLAQRCPFQQSVERRA
jgi:uncharacterized protein (TIGR02246 family)